MTKRGRCNGFSSAPSLSGVLAPSSAANDFISRSPCAELRSTPRGSLAEADTCPFEFDATREV